MNQFAIQHNYFVAREELRGSAAASGGGSVERRETVICPKPRRIGLNSHTTLYDPYPMRPRRWHICHQQEVCEANAANEMLDIILAKGSCGADQSVAQVASSPPFFSGSPPRRVSNPLIQDACFVDEKLAPVAPRAIPIISGRFVRESFGNNPTVRVEGFDCLDSDRRNRRIPALALAYVRSARAHTIHFRPSN